MKKLRVCMLGLGRTGREIARAILKEPDLKLEMAICSSCNPALGQDLAQLLNIPDTGIIIDSSNNLAQKLRKTHIDVAVDFSTPEAAVKNAEILAQHHASIVIGTTGFSDIQLMRLGSIADHYGVGIVYAPNITLGVNVLMLLTSIATALLSDYDCTVVESHFKGKKDSPSGTAKKITDAAYKGMAASGFEGDNTAIPVHSIRAGGVIGSHSITLSGEYDGIEIIHDAYSRNAFAQGAIRALRFLPGKQGFFEMKDVLNLEKVLAYFTQEEMNQRFTPAVSHKPLEVVPYIGQDDKKGKAISS